MSNKVLSTMVIKNSTRHFYHLIFHSTVYTLICTNAEVKLSSTLSVQQLVFIFLFGFFNYSSDHKWKKRGELLICWHRVRMAITNGISSLASKISDTKQKHRTIIESAIGIAYIRSKHWFPWLFFCCHLSIVRLLNGCVMHHDKMSSMNGRAPQSWTKVSRNHRP